MWSQIENEIHFFSGISFDKILAAFLCESFIYRVFEKKWWTEEIGKRKYRDVFKYLFIQMKKNMIELLYY